MLAFVQLEVICGIILIAAFAVSFPLHVLTLHFRHFAPLRDVQPHLCMLTHGGYFMFTVHLFFAWNHANELCYTLSVVQLLGNVLLYGCFICKHYALHKRYRMVSSSLPTHIVFALSAFPFLILCTYRVALREENHCPEVDAVAASCGLLAVVVAMAFFALKEHPSSHFVRAKRIECGAMLFSIAASYIHQWVNLDAVIVALLFLCSIAANISFFAYVLPPIKLALVNGSDFTDEQHRLINESIINPAALGSGNNEPTCGDLCARKMASCVKVLLGCHSEESESIDNRTFSSNPATPIRRADNLAVSSERTLLLPSPAQQRQELETQQELNELIEIIKEGDYYRLQKVVNRRGVALINIGDAVGRTPLHHAVRVGELNCIRFLHAMGADTNRFDNNGRAPLHDAVRHSVHQSGGSSGHIHTGDRCMIITELLRSGAVVNLPTSHGNTALHYAVLGNLLGAVNTLLRHDANPLFQHDKEDAALSWQEAHVAHCLAVGGDHALRKSPLMLAVEMGNVSIVSSMIHHMKSAKKVNFDTRCIHGMTMLHIAVCLGNAAVVQVLLREGCCSPWAIHEESNMNVFHLGALGDSALSIAYILQQMGATDLIPEETEFSSPPPKIHQTAALPTAIGNLKHNYTIQSGSKQSHRPLGSGVEHVLLGADLSTSSAPPSPCERVSRGNSFFGGKVMFGCLEPLFGASPQSMGFGEAMAVLREHIPQASADHSKVDELEAAVDRVVNLLKTKSNVREIERVQCAMVVVCKRLRMSGTRSMSGVIMSAASMPGSAGVSLRGMSGDTMHRVKEYLRQSDHVGMTPLHYAIQQRNANLVHIFASYGGVATNEEVNEAKKRRRNPSAPNGEHESDEESRSSPSSQVSDTPGFANNTLCGGALNFGDEVSANRPLSPTQIGANDTTAFIGSLTQNFGKVAAEDPVPDLEGISLKSYTRDIRRYIDDDEETQDFVFRALYAGVSTYAAYVKENHL